MNRIDREGRKETKLVGGRVGGVSVSVSDLDLGKRAGAAACIRVGDHGRPKF